MNSIINILHEYHYNSAPSPPSSPSLFPPPSLSLSLFLSYFNKEFSTLDISDEWDCMFNCHPPSLVTMSYE